MMYLIRLKQFICRTLGHRKPVIVGSKVELYWRWEQVYCLFCRQLYQGNPHVAYFSEHREGKRASS